MCRSLDVGLGERLNGKQELQQGGSCFWIQNAAVEFGGWKTERAGDIIKV